MILKLNSKQSEKVRKLARRECCNCVDGNCLLLDDGKAVLPAEKELYEEILQQNNSR